MSSTADEELDKLEAELRPKPKPGETPFIHPPDDLPISDGSSCFLDKDRACGADCRAYDTGVTPAQGPECCTILSSVMDLADGIKPFITVVHTLRKVQEDKTRAAVAAAPVPDPTGKKRG